MADCKLNLKAPNGNKSNLFKSFVAKSNNPVEAIQMYYYTKTDKFKETFGDYTKPGFDSSKLDKNGEPRYSSLSDEAWLHDEIYAEVELDAQASAYANMAKVMPNILNTLNTKINYLEHSKGDDKTLKRLKELVNILENEAPEDSIPKFIESSKEHVAALKTNAEKEVQKAKPNIRVLAGINKAAQSYSVMGEIQASLYENKEIKALFGGSLFELGDALGNIQSIETMYISESKEQLINDFHKRDSSWSRENIRKWLDESPRDVKFTERMLEYIGDSHDKVLAMVGEIVMEAEHNKRRTAIEFNEQLSEVLSEVEKATPGGNAEEVFGELIIERNGVKSILDVGVAFTNGKDKAQDAEYNRLMSIKANKPELFRFLQFYSDTYADMQTLVGIDMGTRLPSVLKGIRERGQGKTLKDRYDMLSDDAKKAFKKSNLDQEQGEVLLDGRGKPIKKIPVFYTQKYDSIDFAEALEEAEEIFKNSNLTGEELADQKQRYAEEKASKKMAKLITTDLAKSLQSFHAMATNYAEKYAVIDTLESTMAVVGSTQRKYTLTDSGGAALMRKMKGSNGTPIYIPGTQSTAKEVLETFIDMQVYGQTQKDLGYVDIPFLGKVDTNKVLRGVNNYTSLAQMAGNITASISNIANGEHNNVLEIIAGEYFDNKSYKQASNLYRKNVMGFVGDIGQRTPSNIINLLNERYDVLQDFTAMDNIKGTEETRAKRLFKTDALFMLNNSGEHFLQMRSGLAVMAHTKTYNKDGVEVGNLLDAHTEVDGKLVVADVYVKGKDGELVKFDTNQENRIANKMSAVNRKLHGNYNQRTTNEMKQDARLAMVMKFRDWAYDGLIRRYGKKQEYRGLEQEMEGFYRTSGRFISTILKDAKRFQLDTLKAEWNKLTPHEKANIRRTATELAMVAVLGVGSAMLGKAGKLIEDEYDSDSFMDQAVRGGYMLSLYEVNRLYTELFAFMNPKEALRLMQTPAASTSLLENTIKLIEQGMTGPLEEYKTGWRKGELKIGVTASKLIPMYKHFETLNEHGLKDKGAFYNLN